MLEELHEAQEDLIAFQRAHDAIHQRVQAVKDEGRLLKLVSWSGTAAVMGALDLSIHSLEHVCEEMEDILARLNAGELPNIDEE